MQNQVGFNKLTTTVYTKQTVPQDQNYLLRVNSKAILERMHPRLLVACMVRSS